ncbi:MAG TPA: zinc ribbon domain-containing protein [Actinomycetota bacterium]|jgi:rRNA maturation endonuclease Nob1|nr:zinc ribbon domain-containing protein [Actinomycetota bacterium]
MSVVRRCLGCGETYPPDEHACPKCGSHAGEVEKVEKTVAKPKPPRRPRKT